MFDDAERRDTRFSKERCELENTRRTVLKTSALGLLSVPVFGGVGGAREDIAAAKPLQESILVILSRCDDVDYRVAVDGDAWKAQTTTAKAASGDEIYREDGYTVVDGETEEDSYWDGDAYGIRGPIVEMEIDGDAHVVLENRSIRRRRDVLEILSRDTDVEYRVTVDGDARKTETARAKPGGGDEIYEVDGYTVIDGETYEDSEWDGDAYDIDGPLVRVESDGDAVIAIGGGTS